MQKNKKASRNPKDRLSDTTPGHFEKNGGQKVDHETMNSYSKSDMINRHSRDFPRDAI